MVTAVSAYSFTNSIGVELHLADNGAGDPYGNMTLVQQDLAYLNPDGVGTGVATLRDDTWAPTSELETLGAAGYHLDIYAAYSDDSANAASSAINAMQPLVNAGYMRMIEGPLEVDNSGWGLVNDAGASYVALNGHTYTGWQAAVEFQDDLWNTFSKKTKVALFSLAVPTDGSANSAAVQAAGQLGLSLTSISDVGNVHFYQHNGNAPATEMQGVINQETGYTPGEPFAITETGFNDLDDGSTNYWGSQYSDACYTLNETLDAFKAGAQLTDLYELFDDPTISGFEGHWGLFTGTGAPKESATALHNMMAVLGDSGATATTFTPGSLNYSVSGLASDGNSLLMEKSNGAFDIAVWADANIYTNGVTSTAPTQTVTVNLGATFGTVEVFDLLQGSTPIETLSNASSVSLSIADHPLIVEVEPGSTSSSSGTAPAGSSSSGGSASDSASGGCTAAADLCGTGCSSIVWTSTSGETDAWMMSGQGVAAATGLLPASTWTVVGAGDFSGDGRDGLLWQNGSTGCVIAWADADDTTQAALLNGTVSPNWSVAGVGDFTGNGRSDILWQNASGEVDVWLMNGLAPITEETLLSPAQGVGWSVVGVGDFTGNGTDDVLFRNASTGEVDLKFINGGAIASSATLLAPGTASEAWAVAGVGDFTGDGTDDILWRNASTGEVDMWIMQNGTVASTAGLLLNTNWQVAGVGDYSGDGKSDILWHNAGTGETDMWTMNGNNISATAGLLANAAWTPDTHLLASA